MITELISNINLQNKFSWEDKLFITIDIDWAHDVIIEDTLNLLEEAQASATLLITHKTKLLSKLFNNKLFELGIHPNFNNLLNGTAEKSLDSTKVISKLLEIVPNAKCVRSHSMTQNSKLLDIFHQKQIKYDLNHFIPLESGIKLRPWKSWNGIIKVPYFWEDDIDCINNKKHNMKDLLLYEGIKVVDFHPIHIFLNTESLERYEASRIHLNNPKELKKMRFDGYGTRSKFKELLEQIKSI